jgi:5-(carboxyamino)imidazole ribonucleotide mutase
MAVNGSRNAGLLAVRILAVGDDTLMTALDEFQREIATAARAQDADVQWTVAEARRDGHE